MKRFLFFIVFILSFSCLYGQGYTQALGVRAGWASPGIEYRYYTSDVNSLKALLATRDHGLQLHGFAEFFQYDLFPFSHQLILFYGLGAHIGYESWDVTRNEGARIYYDTHYSLLAGLDGLAGIEYVFYEAPLMAGIEIKPFFDLFGRNGLDVMLFDLAFTIKYIF